MIGLIELRIGLIELGIGLMELGIGLRNNNARRTVLARGSGLVSLSSLVPNPFDCICSKEGKGNI